MELIGYDLRGDAKKSKELHYYILLEVSIDSPRELRRLRTYCSITPSKSGCLERSCLTNTNVLSKVT